MKCVICGTDEKEARYMIKTENVGVCDKCIMLLLQILELQLKKDTVKRLEDISNTKVEGTKITALENLEDQFDNIRLKQGFRYNVINEDDDSYTIIDELGKRIRIVKDSFAYIYDNE